MFACMYVCTYVGRLFAEGRDMKCLDQLHLQVCMYAWMNGSMYVCECACVCVWLYVGMYVDILKSQPATHFPVENHCAADF